MPIYEYQCKKCGNHAEVLQKFSDPPIAKCEVCNGAMKKLISHSAFHLKGTGWYVTDYASNSSSRHRPSEGSKATSGSTEKSSEVKAKGADEGTKKSAPSNAND